MGIHRVSVFTSDGHLITTFGRKGKELGEFDDPREIKIDVNGILYIYDYGNCRIQAFNTTELAH